jgi:menaquinone-9 beta-reductase
MYDLIVIGGGPAGCAAAITAVHGGADVLLLEAGDYPRHKVCGEFISPEACGLLGEMTGGLLPLASCQSISRARIFIDGQVLETEVQPAALSIARFEMDAALWAAAACAGVETRLQTQAENVEGSGPFSVGTAAERVLARSVINASGRWSRLMARPRVPSSAAIGIKAHFREEALSHSVDLYFFRGGYCGVSPVASSEGKHEATLNVSAIVNRREGTSLGDIFARNRSLLRRSRGWTQLTATLSTYPLAFHKPCPLQGNILLAGDAAGFIDPFVGDGIALGLRSGVMAAQALAPLFRRECSLTQAAAEYRRNYDAQIAPCFRAASRIRRLVSLPSALRWPLTRVVQITGWTRRFLRATRPGTASPQHDSEHEIAA